jgi:hypothetical protein
MKPQIIIVTIRLLTKISSSDNNSKYNQNNHYNSSNKNKEESFMGEGEDEAGAVLTIQMLKILTGNGDSLFLYFSTNIT